jgi:dsDNA-specific endonuclease/ATPase MutS2
MRRKFAILFATVLVSVSGATACSGVQEDLQKRAQEEVEKGRKQVEQKVQEGKQRVEEEVKKTQKQVEKGQ